MQGGEFESDEGGDLKLTNPLVSIIVITYNSSKYVLETLESAKAQTYVNIELIVSDDCSTDNTVEICRKWIGVNSSRFIRAELLTVEKNTGIPANCNRGVKASRGGWIKLIAGDDILNEDCLSIYVRMIKQEFNVQFFTSELEYIDLDSKKVQFNNPYYDKIRSIFFSSNVNKQLKEYVRCPVFINSPAFFIKRELLEEIDYFDEQYVIYEDTSLVFNTLLHKRKILYIPISTVKYRIDISSISRNEALIKQRVDEQVAIFKKFRSDNLVLFNPIDLSIHYEHWITYFYKGKWTKYLRKLSLYYWYIKFS